MRKSRIAKLFQFGNGLFAVGNKSRRGDDHALLVGEQFSVFQRELSRYDEHFGSIGSGFNVIRGTAAYPYRQFAMIVGSERSELGRVLCYRVFRAFRFNDEPVCFGNEPAPELIDLA